MFSLNLSLLYYTFISMSIAIYVITETFLIYFA
nr:MAG TPA: hypothetical protein [Caudoviricetes sp.]